MSPIAQGLVQQQSTATAAARGPRSSVRIRPRRRRGLLARPGAAGRWDGPGLRDQAGCFPVAACGTCLATVCGPCWLRGGVVSQVTLAAGADGQLGLVAPVAVVISLAAWEALSGPEERRDHAAGCRAARGDGSAGCSALRTKGLGRGRRAGAAIAPRSGLPRR